MNFGDVFRLVAEFVASAIILQIAVIGLIFLAAFVALLVEERKR